MVQKEVAGVVGRLAVLAVEVERVAFVLGRRGIDVGLKGSDRGEKEEKEKEEKEEKEEGKGEGVKGEKSGKRSARRDDGGGRRLRRRVK